MARVSVRVGVARISLALVPLGVFFGALGAVCWSDAEGPGRLIAAFLWACAGLALFFAFVHPDRVLELDDDDAPDRQVGDRVD